MASEWRKHRIKDVVSFVVDNRGKTPPTQDEGHILLEVNAVSATEKFPLYQEVRKHVSQEVYGTRFRKGHPKKGDILVPTVGTLGAVSLMDRDDCCIAQNLIAIRCDETICHSHFLYYVLCNPMTRKRLLNLNIGGVQPSIKVPHLMELEIELPGIGEQKKIAELLSLLDDKIFCNNRINDNLEQQAAALIARYQAVTDTSIELSAIMDFENGFAFQSSTYLAKGAYRIITIKNVQDGRIDSDGAAYIDSIPPRMKNGCKLHIGDALLSLTGNVGRVGIVCENNLLMNQRVAKIVPHDPELLPFLYFVFRLPNTKTMLESIAKGTAQLNLSPVETLRLTIPFDKETALQLSRDLDPIFQAIAVNNQESISLATARDTLLPRLMCGEIAVD